MKHEKITPEIAAIYLGQKFDIVKMPTHWDEEYRQSIGNIVGPSTLTFLGSYPELEILLHLRSMDSLTEAEARELYSVFETSAMQEKRSEWVDTAEFQVEKKSCLQYWWNGSMVPTLNRQKRLIGSPAVWLKLLSWGFDLFQLIKNGLSKEIK